MTETPSLPTMIASLRKTVAFHKEREAFHAGQQAYFAEQEKLHAEERVRHAAELEAASLHLEELQQMAARLGEVVQQARMASAEPKEETLGRNPRLSHALDQVLETWPLEVAFTATSIGAEVHRRYGALLRRDVNPRAIAAALRRRREDGLIEEVREGRPYLETQYRKVR